MVEIFVLLVNQIGVGLAIGIASQLASLYVCWLADLLVTSTAKPIFF